MPAHWTREPHPLGSCFCCSLQLNKATNLYYTHYMASLCHVDSVLHQLSMLWLLMVVFKVFNVGEAFRSGLLFGLLIVLLNLATFWLLQWALCHSSVVLWFFVTLFVSVFAVKWGWRAGMGVDVPWALLITQLKCVTGLIRVWMLEICCARLS